MFLVCGEALFDVFIGDGEHAGNFQMNAVAGGSPFNVAMGLSRLGQQSALLTGLSSDEMGNRLIEVLNTEHVSTEYLMRTERPTTVVMVSVSASGQPHYAFYGAGSADCGVTTQDLPLISDDVIGIHFGSYSLVVKPVADAYAHLMENAGDRFISIDPNIRPTIEPNMQIWRERLQHYAPQADLIKISAEDVEYLYGDRPHQDLADELLSAGAQLVVITDGSAAVKCWTRSGLSASYQPASGTVIDTVGAGDSFQAALLTWLMRKGNPRQQVRRLEQNDLDALLSYAARAASITCSRQGADLPRVAELSG